MHRAGRSAASTDLTVLAQYLESIEREASPSQNPRKLKIKDVSQGLRERTNIRIIYKYLKGPSFIFAPHYTVFSSFLLNTHTISLSSMFM